MRDDNHNEQTAAPDDKVRRRDALRGLREQARLFSEIAKDAGFRSPIGPAATWVATTSALVSEVDVSRGSQFRERATDLLRVGAQTGSRNEFKSLLAEVSVRLETEIASLTIRESKELEQKFNILFSAGQAESDFAEWRSRLGSATPIAVLFVDLDHFSELNTEYTEEMVDRDLLPPVMRFLRGVCTARGSAYRQGGDEFIVLLPNTGFDEARAFAERLRTDLPKQAFSIGGTSVTVTASIGVTCSEIEDTNFAGARARANVAKREAKGTRNCVRP